MDDMLKRIANGINMVLKKIDVVSNRLEPKPIDKICIEIDSYNTFCKVKANAFGIEKVLFSFVEFDAKSKKLKSNIDCYMGLGETLSLCNDILSGKISKLAAAEKAKGEKYPKSVYSSTLGGINEEKVKERNLRSDGKAISRIFYISPGAKAPFLITAEQKAGHTEGTGIIVPEGNPEIVIRVPLDGDKLKSFALITKAHIEGYISAQYATNAYAYERKENN